MKKSALKKEIKRLRALKKRVVVDGKRASRPAVPSTAGKPSDVASLRLVSEKKSVKIRDGTLARARVKPIKQAAQINPFQVYAPPPGVLPSGHKPLAMDTALTQTQIAWAGQSLGAYWTEGLVFPGYAYLSELTLRAEYRVISQVIATEMTRKWITFQATDDEEKKEAPDEEGVLVEGEHGPGEEELTDKDEADPELSGDADPAAEMQEGLMALQQAKEEKDEAEKAMAAERAERLAGDDGKADRIKELVKEFERLNVRDLFARIAEFDGYFGRVHLYVDTDKGNDPVELLTDLGDGANDVTKEKLKKGDLKRLAVIEPVWTYPQNYNANDPLVADWYNPSQWFVMGKQIHASRLLTFVGRPVPDILKPAYAFGGLSLSQLCKPYVDNWLQTRSSVNDIIRAFSVMVLQTDLTARLQNGDDDLFGRVDLFNALRDNRGTFVVDKEGEDFKNVSAPLGSLDNLQAQAQEHMAAVSRIPLVKLLGISPHGLNASSEGELKAFYDTINSYQEFLFRPNLTRVMHFAMMNLWGEVDEDITFKFNPLWAMNEKEEAEVRKIKAETWDIMVNGVAAVHPEEVRKVVATDPDSDFQGIDVADVPDAPVSDTLASKGHQAFAKGAQGEEQQDGEEAGNPFGQQAEDAASWNESDHPRAPDGEFTSGGGSSGSSKGSSGKQVPEPNVGGGGRTPSEDVKSILTKATKGSGLTSANLSSQERQKLKEWISSQPKASIPVYRGIWLSSNDWQQKHQEWLAGSDVEFSALSSFTADPIRSAAYGRGGDYFIQFEIPPDSSVDISKWSVYPQEEEHILPESAKFSIVEKKQHSPGFWKIKLSRKDAE